MIRARCFIPWLFALTACASTVDGTAWHLDGGRDVAPGLNPDGDDPFRSDAPTVLVDGSTDRPVKIPPDAAVFDPRTAWIWLGTTSQEDVPATLVQAEFRVVPRPDETRCTYLSASNWDIITCRDGSAPRDPHPTPFPNPGVITIDGGARPLTLRPGPQGQYPSFYEQSVLLGGPRTLTLRAPGTAAVPPIALSVDVPPSLSLTEPLLVDGTTTLARDADFMVAWQSNPARSVYVSLTAQGTLDGQRVSLRVLAEFVGSVGRGVIPRRAIAEFSRLTAVSDFRLAVVPQNVVNRRLGAWPLQVVAQGVSVTAAVRLQ
jgi:hypothetical protein